MTTVKSTRTNRRLSFKDRDLTKYPSPRLSTPKYEKRPETPKSTDKTENGTIEDSTKYALSLFQKKRTQNRERKENIQVCIFAGFLTKNFGWNGPLFEREF